MEHESFFADPRTWVAVAVVIFFALFGARLWKELCAALDKHGASVRAELDEASRLRKEAEQMLTDAKLRREQALSDAKALLESAHAEAMRVGEQARADAEATGKRRERMAMDRIAAAEKAAVTEVRVAAAEIATRAAAEVIRGEFTAETDAAVIDRAISGLPAALSRARAA